MAGDAQMAPDDLADLLDPVVAGRADFAKGNRLVYGNAWNNIPKIRYLGNAAMSLLTKIASGYWHVADSQSGIAHSIPARSDVSGSPAISHRNWLKSCTIFSHLPQMRQKIRELEKKVEQLEENSRKGK